MNAKEFGEKLKEYRLSAGLTLTQLGDMIDYSNPYLSQIENGKKGIPSPELLKKLSQPLGISYNELMFRAGHFNEHEYRSIKDYEARIEELNNKLVKVINILSEDGEFLPKVREDLIPVLKHDSFTVIPFQDYIYTFENYIKESLLNNNHINEFNKFYNVKEVKEHLLNYVSDDYKEEILKELERIAIKYNLLELELGSNSNDLADLLNNEDITYKNNPINNQQRKLLSAYLDALLPNKK